jgi:hypothetical protein
MVGTARAGSRFLGLETTPEAFEKPTGLLVLRSLGRCPVKTAAASDFENSINEKLVLWSNSVRPFLPLEKLALDGLGDSRQRARLSGGADLGSVLKAFVRLLLWLRMDETQSTNPSQEARDN